MNRFLDVTAVTVGCIFWLLFGYAVGTAILISPITGLIVIGIILSVSTVSWAAWRCGRISERHESA